MQKAQYEHEDKTDPVASSQMIEPEQKVDYHSTQEEAEPDITSKKPKRQIAEVSMKKAEEQHEDKTDSVASSQMIEQEQKDSIQSVPEEVEPEITNEPQRKVRMKPRVKAAGKELEVSVDPEEGIIDGLKNKCCEKFNVFCPKDSKKKSKK